MRWTQSSASKQPDNRTGRATNSEGSCPMELCANRRAYIERLSIPEPNSGCWLWLGPAHRVRAEIRPFIHFEGKGMLAHRASLAAFKGLPDGLCALHTCHNTLCVNPDHLYPGTKKQNTADMMRAGRHYAQSGAAAIEELTKRIRRVNLNRRSKPVCRRGHPRSSENIYVNPNTGYKTCLPCVRITRLAQKEG